jgi:hypothetical protein
MPVSFSGNQKSTGEQMPNKYARLCAIAAIAFPAAASAFAATGRVTAVYNNARDPNATVIYGRMITCTLDGSSNSDAQSCARDWAEEWCNHNGDPTCHVIDGTPAEAKSNGTITNIDAGTINYSRTRN